MTNVAMLQTAADLSASITAQGVSSLVPAGVVMAYAGATAPTGWLLCNGSAISRSTYADLFTAIGVAHGYGDNSTTFNLPDYRGRFIRGRDGAVARDPNAGTRTAANTGGNTGDAVGSVQGDVLQGFRTAGQVVISETGNPVNGQVVNVGSSVSGSAGNGINATFNSANNTFQGAYFNRMGVTGTITTDTVNGTPRTSSETRPLNAYVNYIIKI